MKVILISGKAQHGKDTVAKHLEKELKGDGKTVLITHYADLLKFICKNYFEWDGKKDPHGRQLLQTVGTDILRKKYPGFFIEFVKRVLFAFPDAWDYVIVPDCRFLDEISNMKSDFDAVHLAVVRDGFDNGLSEEQKDHPSEVSLDGVQADYTIHNNGTLRDLRAQIEKLLDATSCFTQKAIREVVQES